MARYPNDLEWAQRLTAGEPRAWQEFESSLLPRLPWLGPSDGPDARGLLDRLKGRDGLSRYTGHAPLRAWVQAFSLQSRREGTGGPAFPPEEIRDAASQAVAALSDSGRDFLRHRYVEGRSLRDIGQDRGEVEAVAAQTLRGELRTLLGQLLAQLGRERASWFRLDRQATDIATAVCAALSESATEAATAFDLSPLFQLLSTDDLARGAENLSLSPEAAAHLDLCPLDAEAAEQIRSGETRALSGGNPKLRWAMAGLGLIMVVLLGAWAAGWIGDKGSWEDVQAVAKELGGELAAIRTYLETARGEIEGEVGDIVLTYPRGDVSSAPRHMQLVGNEPDEGILVKLKVGEQDQGNLQVSGTGSYLALPPETEHLPGGVACMLEFVQPDRIAGKVFHFRIAPDALALSFKETAEKFRERLSSHWEEAGSIALHLGWSRFGEAYHLAKAACSGDNVLREEWILLAAAAYHVGDIATRDLALSQLETTD